ncbi:hypothetical protein MPSEU_000012800 [Mayamaea pseudoterrestris]|nr:hypothetical protein MPSEU_000012800 [Mayamaea pseudoterrestris]
MSSSAPALDAKAFFYMTLLALQFGVQPILTRTFTSNQVIRTTVVLAQEAVKLVMAFGMLNATGQIKKALQNWTLSSSVTVALVPATLYAIQNMCSLMAYQNLDALTYNVLNQTKTLSAALCCYLVMGRKQSNVQIVALFLLIAAALIVEKIISIDTFSTGGEASSRRDLQESQLHEHDSFSLNSKHWTHGVIPILAASFISGMTGAMTQRSLQSANGGRNPYLFSMELCVGGLVVLFINLLLSGDGADIINKGFFHGWQLSTLVPVLTNAAGGIIVGLVTKYAGSVRKGFALIFGLLFSGVYQAVSSSEGISNEHVVGGLLAALSLYLHAAFPPTRSATQGMSKAKTE